MFDLFDSISLAKESNVQTKNLRADICEDCLHGTIAIKWPFDDYFVPFAVSIWITDHKEDDIIHWYNLIVPYKDSARAKDIAEIIKLWRLSRSSPSKELRDSILDVHPRLPTFILKYFTITVSSYLLCKLSKFIADIQGRAYLSNKESDGYYSYSFRHKITKFKLAEKIRLDLNSLVTMLLFILGLVDNEHIAAIQYAKVYHSIRPREGQDERLSISFDFSCHYYVRAY